MDSPQLQSSPSHLQRMRTTGNLSVHPVNSRGAIQKRAAASSSRNRSVSTTQVDRLHQLALQQNQADIHHLPPNSFPPQWLTPQNSPQPQVFTAPLLEQFPQWTVPTPPHSDSGVPTVSVDVNEEPVTSSIHVSQDFQFDNPTASAEMSSLGFLLPSQYGAVVEAEPSSYTMDQNYPPMRMSQPPATSGASAYTQTISSSPALYQSRTMPASTSAPRRHSEAPNASPNEQYGQGYRRISTPYDSMQGGDYSMTQNQSIPSISGITQSPLPSPHAGTTNAPGMMPPQYNAGPSRSPNLYDSGIYAQPFTTAPATTQLYASSQSLSYPPPFVGSSVNEVLAKPLGSDSSIRVLNQRPKPQCWEHGCNGRQFSTFSNLLRHQREKSGTASKSYCPKCGAEFTRTTARNGHLAHDKCTKQRRPSDDDK